MARAKRELASKLNITRLPLAVKLEIGKRTRDRVITRRPSTFTGSALTLSLPVGKQLVSGAGKAASLIFKEIRERESENLDAVLRVKLVDYNLDHRFSFPVRVLYTMSMVVETELLAKDGTRLYEKDLTVNYQGFGETRFGGFGQGADWHVRAIEEGNATLVALWVRSLAKDITEHPKVLQFAQQVAQPSSVAEVPSPEIMIASPVNGSSTDRGEIQLVGSVRSTSPLATLLSSVNGRPLSQTRDLSVGPKDSHATALNRKVPLALGENVISVTATNQAGGTSQTVVWVVRVAPGLGTEVADPRSPVGERWAVVVGISHYRHRAKGIPDLSHAAGDARALAAFLRSPQGGAFPEQNVLLLTNEQATSAALRRGLFTFLKRAIEEDLVVFFYSGQGAPEPGSPENYYLLTYDADPDDLPSTAVATWDVNTAFERNIKAKRAVMFVDASHVSAIGRDTGTRGVGASNLINRYLKELAAAGEGRAIFTATQEGQLALGRGLKGRQTGLFTHYLLEALTGAADENGDGTVTLGETLDYTTDLVVAASRGKQRPDIAGTFDRSLPLAVIK